MGGGGGGTGQRGGHNIMVRCTLFEEISIQILGRV